MRIRNALRVLFSNVNMIYKSVFFRLAITIVIALLGYFILLPQLHPVIFNDRTTALLDAVSDIFVNFFSGKEVNTEALPASYSAFLGMLGDNLGKLFFVGLGTVLLYLIYRIICRASDYTFCVILDKYMSSRAHMGFVSAFINNIGRAFLFSVIEVAIRFLCEMIIIGIGVTIAVYGLPYLSVLSILLGLICLVFGFALETTLLSAFMPYMAASNKSVGYALKNTVSWDKRTTELIGNYVFLYLFFFYLNVSFAIFTFLSGLIVTIPLSALCFTCIATVDYYLLVCKKYYIDDDTIVIPREIMENAEYLKYM